jgi:hypothetical protein
MIAESERQCLHMAGGDAQRVEALLLDSIAAPEDAKRLAAAHWAAQVQ